MPNAHIRHIMVTSEEECLAIKARIEGGEDFTACATKYSKCPTGRRGGNLGVVKPGQLVDEVDEVAFSGELRKIHGPVKSQFGYHLIQILGRTD